MLTLAFFACDTTSETSNNDLDTCSVNFKVAVNGASDNNTVSRALDEILNCNEIYDVTADIFGPDNALLQQGGPWDCEVGQGTVTDVPAGTDGTLAVLCNNEAGEVIYRGVSVITLIPGATVDAGTIVTDEFMPSQLSPADNATEINGNVNFGWDAVTGAAKYDIQVTSPSTVDYTTSDTNYRAHDLTTPYTTYTWRIRAVDSQENQGAWSNTLSFITDGNYIPSPLITSPSGDVSGNVLFDGQTSFDSDTDGSIVSHVWNLVETGEEIGTTSSFTKNDLALGNHTVQLVVTDDVGAIATATSAFTVTEEPIYTVVGDNLDLIASMTGVYNPLGCYASDFPTSGQCSISQNFNVYTLEIVEGSCMIPGVCTTYTGTISGNILTLSTGEQDVLGDTWNDTITLTFTDDKIATGSCTTTIDFASGGQTCTIIYTYDLKPL
jgi:hypothetical protein